MLLVLKKVFTNRFKGNRLLMGSFSMLLSQFVTIASNMLVITILGRKLNDEMFGLWSVLSSFIVMFASLDFGLGQSLRNKLTFFSATKNDSKEEERYFFSVFFILCIVSFLGIILAFVLVSIFPWQNIFNISENYLLKNIKLIMLVVIGNLMFNIPFGLHSSTLLAYQETHWRSLMETCQSLLLAIVIIISLSFEHISFLFLVSSYFITMTCILIIRTMVFVKLRGWKVRLVKLSLVIRIFNDLKKVSYNFWLQGISSVLIFSTGSLIIGKVTGLAEAGDFSIIQKLFVLLISVQSTLLTPLWSAYTQASATGNLVWIKRTFKVINILTLFIFGFGGSVFVVFHNVFLNLWVGKEIHNLPLVVSLSIWALIYALINSTSALLNGMNRIKRQSLMFMVAAIINLPLCFYLGNYYGAFGVSFGSVLAITPILISNIIEIRYMMKSSNNSKGNFI
ncbi:lipopolysaccharide biosynthesis protein ['Paenibacillus yunnanensis' Narsing Rao et al. 2020]|uniref:lipopolysaccharide biosynthesis protein n=1 Tax=Paenibacillus tengchongensis TaxID=2608684 RepID=UPI00124D8BF4|nr:lipopolysaccharide biosynthesis protein [Paenibacillus tengchongensis]